MLCHKPWNHPKLYIQLCTQASFVCLHCSSKVSFKIYKTRLQLPVSYFKHKFAGGNGDIVHITVSCQHSYFTRCTVTLLWASAAAELFSCIVIFKCWIDCRKRFNQILWRVSCIDTWCNLSACVTLSLPSWFEFWIKTSCDLCWVSVPLCFCCSYWSTAAVFFFFFFQRVVLFRRSCTQITFILRFCSEESTRRRPVLLLAGCFIHSHNSLWIEDKTFVWRDLNSWLS